MVRNRPVSGAYRYDSGYVATRSKQKIFCSIIIVSGPYISLSRYFAACQAAPSLVLYVKDVKYILCRSRVKGTIVFGSFETTFIDSKNHLSSINKICI